MSAATLSLCSRFALLILQTVSPTPGVQSMIQAATVMRRTRSPPVPVTPGDAWWSLLWFTKIINLIFRCVMCKCLPSKCDCNPLADDPDSFCSNGDVCKVWHNCTQLSLIDMNDDDCCQDCVCQPRFPPGCSCDPYSPNPDSSCGYGQTCKQCKCLGEWLEIN